MKRPPHLALSKLTLDGVAKLAGVSKATVSRVLNGTAFVAPETAERVRTAVANTGYVPNLLAGGLASRRSRLVAAIVPTISSSIFNATIEAMIEALAESGYQVVLGIARDGEARMEGVVTSMLSRRPDAIILTGTERDPLIRRRLQASGVTIIETWALPAEPLDLAIGFSHSEVGRAIGAFAVEKGYRRPLVITSGLERAVARMNAIIEVFEAAGASTVTDVTTSLALVSGHDRLAAHLNAGLRPDIVLCSSDLLAQGVLMEAQARGLTVPADLAVFGFGDMDFAAHSIPPLTTVRIDGAAIGREAARALLARASGREVTRRIVDVGFSIVARDSV